jgi:membrane fusion protein, multidrug efflux system
MQKNKKIILTSSVFLIIILLIILKINGSTGEKRTAQTPTVVLGNVQVGEISKSETLTGDILPIQQANIYSKVNGNIEKIFVDIGDKVNTNQILALIDTTIYSHNSKQAEANYYQAEVNYENNKLTYDRNQKLYEQNLIAKQDLDNSKTAMDASFAQKDAAYANYLNARTQLSYCKITAPFKGTITKRFYDPGAYISGSGNSLFILMNIDRLKSIVNMPEKDVPILDQISEIEVTADAFPDKMFKAKLKKISGAVDLTTRTMEVEIDIENPSKMLKPGMFASINLIWEKKENALILPDEVVLNDDQGNYVYVVNTQNVVSKKYVTVGIQQNNKDEILSGINKADMIVFVGQNLVRDKIKVKVTK